MNHLTTIRSCITTGQAFTSCKLRRRDIHSTAADIRWLMISSLCTSLFFPFQQFQDHQCFGVMAAPRWLWLKACGCDSFNIKIEAAKFYNLQLLHQCTGQVARNKSNVHYTIHHLNAFLVFLRRQWVTLQPLHFLIELQKLAP